MSTHDDSEGPDLPELGIVVLDPRAMRHYRKLTNLAATDLPVLRLDETGMAEEMAAADPSTPSLPTAGPWVVVHCSCLVGAAADTDVIVKAEYPYGPAAPLARLPVLSEGLSKASRLFERRAIEAALEATGGNKARAAKLLKLPLRTFWDKLHKHHLG